MKAISIHELHEHTEEWVRSAAQYGELSVTDEGRTVARIVPQEPEDETPFFARREMTPAFAALLKSGALRGGTDSTRIISDDRDAR